MKFKSEWKESYPVRAVQGDAYKFYCIPCGRNIPCHHQGLGDVKRHCLRDFHKANETSLKKQRLINFKVTPEADSLKMKAEVMVTNFIVQHNLPLATSDHLGPLFKEVFPDSNIAQSYASGRTKTSAILNEAIAPKCHQYIVNHCKEHPYNVGTDGSNDTRTEKMNPVSIRIFDINRSKTVTNHFFDMCLTQGEHSAKAYKIFEAIDEKFANESMPWNNCVSLSIDNTNAMIGKNNSVASRCLNKNPCMFVAGCPCHLAHIAASTANDTYSDMMKINVEDICIDSFYWFDKSAKRKGKLLEYFEFCDQEYQSILKHLSVRWL